jgi:hypothetical protein
MAHSRHQLILFPVAAGRRTEWAAAIVLLWLAGCGPSTYTPEASVSSKSDVIITLDGDHHTCVVALSGEPQGSTVACADVVPFVRDELRRGSGSSYDIRALGKVDDAQRAKVESDLKGAGYRMAPN